jgi:hypothetical protein
MAAFVLLLVDDAAGADEVGQKGHGATINARTKVKQITKTARVCD